MKITISMQIQLNYATYNGHNCIPLRECHQLNKDLEYHVPDSIIRYHKTMEGEVRKNEFSGSSTNVIPYSDNQLNALSPEIWRDVKTRVATLLDDSVPHSFKKSIAQQLCNLFESLEHKSTTNDELVIANVQSETRICNVNHHDGNEDDKQINKATHEFNDRLRSKIAEFNEGLAHLGSKILKLKTRLLSWNTQAENATDSLDIETCRNVNRNFRRILQKESRYLRDQLYAATETIQRLEKRSLSSSNLHLDSSERNMKIVPYYEELKCRPTDFINIESGAPQLWLMSPVNSLQASGCLRPTPALVHSRSALMKRSAPPLEVVAGPDIKSGKFICSFGGATSTSSSSLVEWNLNQIEQQLSTDVSRSNSTHEYQTEDKQPPLIVI